jgi:serine/threonine protein kinase
MQRSAEPRRSFGTGPALHVGEVLSGKYQLAASLGNGTFAEVWQAKVLGGADGETVALKVLHGRWCKDEIFIRRFETGAKILEQLEHPHIVRLLEPATESQGFRYLAMEYLAGGDLHKAVLKDSLGQNRERWIRAVLDVGRALDYAHQKIPQLVHRDVKPHNILLDEHGRGKLCDFDLVLDPRAARDTQTSQGLGTPDFAAPEQARNAVRVDQRADVYGLAQTMLFVLHGQSWSDGRDPQTPLLDQIETTRAVKDVLRRATEYYPAKRTSTVAKFCEELEAALQVRESPTVVAVPVHVAQVETESAPDAVLQPTPVTVPDVTPQPAPLVVSPAPDGRNRIKIGSGRSAGDTASCSTDKRARTGGATTAMGKEPLAWSCGSHGDFGNIRSHDMADEESCAGKQRRR